MKDGKKYGPSIAGPHKMLFGIKSSENDNIQPKQKNNETERDFFSSRKIERDAR